MSRQSKRIIIGRFERIILPEYGDTPIKVKVDTGAKTSSIHASHIEEKVVNGVAVLEFRLLENKAITLQKHNYQKRRIRSSNGQLQERYVVEFLVQFGEKRYRADFSLSKRIAMNFPILLGRQFLRKGFVVDVSKKYLIKTNFS